MKTAFCFSLTITFILLILLSSLWSYSQSEKTSGFRTDSVTLLKLKDGTTKTGYVVGDRDSLLIFSTSKDGPVIIKKDEVEALVNISKQSVYSVKESESAVHANHNVNRNTSPGNIKKRIISFEFFSPLNHNMAFGYEQVIKNQISLAGEIAIIGPGLTSDERASKGFFLKAGPKIYFSPDWMMDGMYRFNDMQGAYLQPQIVLTYFNSVDTYDSGLSPSYEAKTNTFAYALLLNLGKQWVLAHVISLDLHFGIGYGGNSYSGDNDVFSFNTYKHYSHMGGTNTEPFAMSAGITIGVPIK